MATTFVPLITGGVVEITEGVRYATPWTTQEAIDRALRLACEAEEYASEAVLAKETGWGDPAVFIASARERLAMAEALNTALRSFA